MGRKKLEKPILAEGEVTGHCHRLTKDVDVFETDGGEREFTLTEPTNLIHEEHKVIELPVNTHNSDKVIEHNPFLEESRKVLD